MDIEVDRDEYTRWRVSDAAPRALAEGEARLRIDRFGFSSNNISYAAIGDMLRYWDFFPPGPTDADDATRWGLVPVWGFAEVVETRSSEVTVGERIFGFFPMATELVIEVGNADAFNVFDVAAHRAGLAGPYNSYRRCAADVAYRADGEEVMMLLYPLFFTSFVIDDFLSDKDDFGAEQVVISSASAKTALGAAHRLHARGVKTIGLTSVANVAFCRSLGVYDEVLTYGEAESIAQVSTAFVDVSGDQAVVASVHRRLGDQLRHSMIVGDTHWDSAPLADEGPLPGPAQEFLFAPSQVTKRSREWGADVLAARMAEAWNEYSAWTQGWITLDRVAGPEAVIEVFRTYLAGRVDPTVGTVCTMHSQHQSEGVSA